MTRLSVERSVDWRAARGEAVLLGAAALVPIAASSHAAAVKPPTALGIAVDGFHLLATGVWAGGLLPLALLLRAAGREEGADARPYAVLAAHRFSGCAVAAVLALVLSGATMAVTNVGTVAGLVGTRYGRLLLLKIALLVPVLTLAAVNRSVHLPRLSADGATVGRPAMRRLARFVVAEGALALAILAVVGAMGVTPPARHEPPGAGDGPDGGRLLRRPADLRAPHTAQHTAGDLFWWITHGIPRAAMPAFGDRVSEEERWDLVNFLRALSSAHAARSLGPVVEPQRSWLVAPDFTFAVGPTPTRALKEYRGRRIVLLVLYALPGSRPRMAQLAQSYDVLVTLGAEVIAVPTDAAPDALKRLGAEPRVLFPVVTDGAAEIVAAY